MRKRVIISLVLLVLFGGGFIFYRFFPQIWGDLVFPLEHEETIRRYAQEFNLDPALLAAVIFRESRFNETSVSRAGARGLMQIIPGTGSSIARRIGVTDFSTEDLFNPEINIRFGAFYLRSLLDNYANNLDLALAGYNAGGAVADRLRATGDYNVLPRETFFFISNVKNTIEWYRKIYPDRLTAPTPTPERPKTIIEFLQPSSIPFWQKPIRELLKTLLLP